MLNQVSVRICVTLAFVRACRFLTKTKLQEFLCVYVGIVFLLGSRNELLRRATIISLLQSLAAAIAHGPDPTDVSIIRRVFLYMFGMPV